MSETQKVLFEILLENGEFKVRSKESKEALEHIGQGAKNSTSGLDSMSKGVRTLATVIKGFIALEIVKKFFQMGKAAVESASKLQETQNKFRVTFSGIRAEAEKTAKVIEDSFGMASEEAMRFLSDTGDLLTGLGMTQEKALDLSNSVVSLGADLASFTNLEGGTERAVAALTSGLLGEREAMKALGIVINEEMIQNELRKQGKDKLTGLALQEAKAEATLQLALEQSKNAIGDTARSYDSYANVSRRVDSRLAAMSTSIGNDLLPAVTNLGLAFLSASKDGGFLASAAHTITKYLAGMLNQIALVMASLNATKATNAKDNVSAAWKQASSDMDKYGDELEKHYAGVLDSEKNLQKAAKEGNEIAIKFIDARNRQYEEGKKIEKQIDDETNAYKEYNKILKTANGEDIPIDNNDAITQREQEKKREQQGAGKGGKDKAVKEKAADLDAYYTALGDYESAATAKVFAEGEAQLANAKAMYDQKLISETEYQSAKAAIEENYRQQSVIAEASAWQQKQGQHLAYMRASLGFESKGFQGAQMLAQAGSSLMSQKNKALFNVGKAATLANIGMSAAEAVIKGMSYGPWVGIPYAALVGTTTGIQIAQVLKQKPPQDVKVSSASPSLPSFAVGAYEVPYDMMANIHRKEMILPAPFAESLRENVKGGNGSGGTTIIVQGSIVDAQGLLKIVDDGQKEKASLLGATKYTFKSAY